MELSNLKITNLILTNKFGYNECEVECDSGRAIINLDGRFYEEDNLIDDL